MPDRRTETTSTASYYRYLPAKININPTLPK